MSLGTRGFAQSKGIIKNYSVEENLLSTRVYNSFQDSKGYMWFGTSNGASRFNGVSFRNYSISDGLCDNEVLNIKEDSKGRIWFMHSNNCLSFFDGNQIINSDSIPLLKSDSSNNGIHFLAEDGEGFLHFSGLGKEVIKITSDLQEKQILERGVSSNKLIYPVTTKTNDVIYRPIVRSWPDSTSSDTLTIKWIHQASTTSYWSLSSKGITKYADNKSQLILGADEIPHLKEIEKIYIDSNENIYCFTSKEKGWLYKSVAQSRYTLSYEELPSISYSSIYVDNDNNQWLSSYTNGIHLITDSQRELTVYQNVADERSTCLTLSPDGKILVGSGNRMFKFQERELIDLIQIGSYNDISEVNDIAIDSVNKIVWCASGFKLMGFRFLRDLPMGLGLGNVISLPIKEVNDIYQGPDSIMYLCTGSGLQYFDLNSDTYELKSIEASPNKQTKNIVSTSDQRIWFENNDKLLYLKDGVVTEFSDENYSFKTKITSLHALDNDVLIVCTFGSGVYFIQNDAVIYHLSSENGLISDLCNKIFIHGTTHYLATTEGVVIYEWNGENVTILSTYTHLDGLPSNDINDVTVKDSLVYLASSKGLIVFNSEYHSRYKSEKKNPPQLYLNEFRSKDRFFNMDEEVTLTYDDSFITIDYEAISFVRPDEIIYEYKLHKTDQEWIRTKNTSLEFPRFEAGYYDFVIRARKHDSEWSDELNFSFNSLPPWWASWWFRTLSILAIGAITFIVIRFLAKRKYERQLAIIQKEQALLEERNRISADMHDDLGSELTKIVILSRIARTKLGLSPDKEKPILDIDIAASDIVKKMNEIIWALNPANDSLESLISYLQKYVNEYLDVRDLGGRVAMPEHIPELKVKAAFRRNIFLIVKECLHNIHKHAQASRLDVSIRINHDLEIIIIEDGVGFDMEKTRRFGNGLINMKKRANDINGDVDQVSSIGNGSKLTMIIPLTKNHAFVLDKNLAD